MRIRVSTHFDITETGITRPHRGTPLPVVIRGHEIFTEEGWNKRRRQQNNLETIIQCLCMRAQPENITTPVKKKGVWSFYFVVQDPTVYGNNLELLTSELEGIPMITGLDETKSLKPFLNSKNIWFAVDV